MDLQAWTLKSTDGFVGVMEKRKSGRDIGTEMKRKEGRDRNLVKGKE